MCRLAFGDLIALELFSAVGYHCPYACSLPLPPPPQKEGAGFAPSFPWVSSFTVGMTFLSLSRRFGIEKSLLCWAGVLTAVWGGPGTSSSHTLSSTPLQC